LGCKALVAHSGGPTAVINASLLGVVEEARRQKECSELFGARFGLQGILESDFVNLFAQPEELIRAVGASPSSALGTSRLEASPEDLGRILDVFLAHDIRWFFYTGGNGSMGTAHELHKLAQQTKL
jgi:6-phosphofructokinase